MTSICEGCAFERHLNSDTNVVCIPNTAFRQDLMPKRVAEGKACDNQEVYRALTPDEKADAANQPLG